MDLAVLAAPASDADKNASLSEIRKRLDALTADRESRAAGATQLLSGAPTNAQLQSEEAAWASIKDQLSKLKGDLKRESNRLETVKETNAGMREKWMATQKSPTKLPGEVAARVQDLLQQIDAQDRKVGEADSGLLRLQNDEAIQEAAVDKMLAALDQARKTAMDRLTARDSLPLWQAGAFGSSPEASEPDTKARFGAQLSALPAYFETERGGLLLIVAVWAALIAGFRWARSKARGWAEKEPRLVRSTRIFEVPIAAASVATLAVAPSLLTNSPHLLSILLGALMIVPLLVVIRKLVEPSLMPLTWALAIFYVASQGREMASAIPAIARIILLAETITAASFALWLARISQARRKEDSRRLWQAMVFGANLALVAFAFATVTNILGYANLALFIAHVILSSAFVAVLLYATLRIARGLVTFALCVPPLSLTAAVRNHRALLERRCSSLLHLAAVAAWLWFTLEQLSLRKPLLNQVGFLLTEQFKFGPVTAAGILEFGLTIWAAFLVSRFVRFVLDEEIYRRVKLAAGMPFAISTLLHYAILFVGFYLAAAILVGDMTKFTILAGAFSVGIGFGLQNVVNNFVSGIIVLFERPVKLGDVIQVGTDVGIVRRIGIRATVMQTQGGSELIIPNGKLISDPVTNWTLSDRQRRVDIAIATPANIDPNRVLGLLIEVATADARVSKNPAPTAELLKIGGGTMSYELHFSTPAVGEWSQIRSDLTIAVHTVLQQNEIPTS